MYWELGAALAAGPGEGQGDWGLERRLGKKLIGMHGRRMLKRC